MASLSAQTDMDLKEALTEKRFVGIWRLLKGYQWIYIGAILGVGVAAIARTATYLLLGYYVDDSSDRLRAVKRAGRSPPHLYSLYVLGGQVGEAE